KWVNHKLMTPAARRSWPGPVVRLTRDMTSRECICYEIDITTISEKSSPRRTFGHIRRDCVPRDGYSDNQSDRRANSCTAPIVARQGTRPTDLPASAVGGLDALRGARSRTF